jgi:hypothetical protein
MHNLSDKDIDHLSKEAADNYEAAPGPAMWHQIQKRLDAEMPVQKKEKKRFFWLFSLSGLLLLSLIIGIKINSVPVQISQGFKAESAVEHIIKKTVQPEIKSNNNTDLNEEKKSKNDLPLTGTGDQNIQLTEQVSVNTKIREHHQKSPELNSPKSDQVAEHSQRKNALQIKEPAITNDFLPIIKTDLSNNKNIEPAGQTEKNTLFKTEAFIDTPEQKKETDDKLQSAATDSVLTSQNILQTENTEQSSATKPKIKSGKLNRFEISGIFGPDFSNVGFVSPEKTGVNIGLMVGYRFTERFSIQTGVLHSRKHYTAVGESYKGYPGANLNITYVKMDWVDANCLMWDIPINIRYDILLRPKQRAFISAGFSSYILSEEDLQYHFRYYGDPGYRAWTNQENSSYMMSVVNLSVGYEQRISSSFSLQAEPFLKIPTREIGYGNINLNSLGIFLSIKYTPAPFLFKNKKTR